MSGKINLGKTKDSRTRGKAKIIENVTVELQLRQELKTQKDFVHYLLKKGFCSGTVKQYTTHANLFLKWAKKENIPQEQIVYADILGYIQHIKKSNNQGSVAKKVNSLKHYFNFLETTGQRTDNPAAHIEIHGIKRKTLYDILSRQELESLYNNFEIPDEESKDRNQNWFKGSVLVSKRNKVILGLMIYQGLNSYELGKLTGNDLKLRQGKIYIPGSRRSNERELKLEAHQVLDIMEYQLQIRPEILRQTGKNSDKLFISFGESSFFHNVMNKLIKKLHLQNSKITTALQIRASVITHWLKIHNLRQVQYMAGHRFVSSTENYKINDLDDLSEDINKYHPIG